MNTFKKLCAGVYGMQTENEYKHGDEVIVTTKYGKEVTVLVWKKIREGIYSVVRDKTTKDRLLAKAEKRKEWASIAEEKSNRDTLTQGEHDFLKLGEPIKVGHHSQRKHERLLERLDNQMRRGYEESQKSEYHKEKAESLKAKAEESLFIDSPDCLEDIKKAYKEAKQAHEDLKGKGHPTFMLTNSRARLKTLEIKTKNAITLWEV